MSIWERDRVRSALQTVPKLTDELEPVFRRHTVYVDRRMPHEAMIPLYATFVNRTADMANI